jgi:hypothetical protein
MILNWLRKFFFGECQQCALLREMLDAERVHATELQDTLFRVTRITPKPETAAPTPVGGFESIRRKRARLERESRVKGTLAKGWKEKDLSKLEEEVGVENGKVQEEREAK